MTNNKDGKDRWIKDMIAKRYLIVNKDGTVHRCAKADDAGNLLSTTYNLVKMQTHKPTGRVYFNVKWRGHTKSVLTNRVVALRYLPNPLNLPQVNHIDGDKQHNFLHHPDGSMQLEWSTGSDNEKHAHRTGLKSGRGSANSNAKLTANDVVAMRAGTDSPAVLAVRYGVSRSTIINALRGTTWSHL
jgi:hypothetical protein